LTVTFWSVEVVDTVKPDEDTLLTVPIVPPSASVLRALDPAAPDPLPAKGRPLLLAVVAGAALLDVAATIP
jgi:hypothetical protein